MGGIGEVKTKIEGVHIQKAPTNKTAQPRVTRPPDKAKIQHSPSSYADIASNLARKKSPLFKNTVRINEQQPEIIDDYH